VKLNICTRVKMCQRETAEENGVHTLCVLRALCLYFKVLKITKGPHHVVFPNWTISNKNYQNLFVLILIESTCPLEFVGVDVCGYINS